MCEFLMQKKLARLLIEIFAIKNALTAETVPATD